MKKISSILKMADIFLMTAIKLAEHDQPSAGMLFYCPEDQTVFLTKRSKTVSNAGTWDIQGGRHDDGDNDSIDTATREAQEEVSTLPKKKKKLGTHVVTTPAQNPYVIHVYSISQKEKEKWTPKVILDHESVSYKWIPYDKIPKKTHFDLTWVPDFIDQQKNK